MILASRKAFLPYAPLAHSEADFRVWISHTLLSSGGVSVVTVRAEVVAVLATSTDPWQAWIDQLYVLPEYVGQGLGSRLLAHAQAQLSRPIRLYTFQANDRARRFYERHGYAAIALTDGSGNEERCPDVLYELA